MGRDGPAPSSGRPAAERRAAGALEAEILAILRAADGPLTPGEVRQRLAPATQAAADQAAPDQAGPDQAGPDQADGQRGELSYSTVVTIVSRLHAKGLLARQRAGRGFTYTPVDDASLAASRMSQVLGSENDHDAVLSRFVSGLSSRDALLLRELLASGGGPVGVGPDPARPDQGRPDPARPDQGRPDQGMGAG
jgi:predicted transcriptional regulator